MRRLLALLPPGTVKVGAGMAVLGGASYVYLAIAGHQLSRSGFSSLSVLWSIVFSIGLGLFFPVEQEVTRLVAALRVTGGRFAPVYRRGALLALAILAGSALLLAAGAPWLADRLFGGDRAMVAVLGAAMAGLAVAHPVRGVLAGVGWFGPYSAQVGVDGVLRIVLSAALGLTGVSSPTAYGLVLMVAPLLGVLATARPARRAITAGAAAPADPAGTAPGDRLSWRAFLAGVFPLTVSTLLAQLMVNLPVIDVRLLAPAAVALAGALLSALVLARVPLFVFGAMQASLLPGLSATVTAGDRAGFRRQLRRACAIVTLLALAGGIPTVIAGPWLIATVFNVAGRPLGTADFAILAAATGAYLLAMVLGQGVLAINRHRAQALAWLVGTLAVAAVTLLPGEAKLRVELAYLAGSAVTAAMLAVVVRRPPRAAAPRRRTGPGSEPGQTAALAALGGAD